MMDINTINSVKKLSITEYLKGRGLYPAEREGKKLTSFSSPFSSDSSPSFYVYEDQNTFHDYSTGYGGDIISLVQKLDDVSFKEAVLSICKGDLLPIVSDIDVKKKDKSSTKGFSPDRYLARNKEDQLKINEYAKSRRITSNYRHAKMPVNVDGEWKSKLGLMFVHHDEDLDVCGIKVRFIDNEDGRFTARGRLMFYILENKTKSNEETKLFLVESETSANSLYEILKERDQSAIVLSIGGVGTNVVKIPDVYDDIKDRYVIIDYDGNDDLYKERLERFKGLGEPVKLELKKDEDINSLYILKDYDDILL